MFVLDLITLTATIGATARLTRLATTDTITELPRTAILARIAQPARLRARAAKGHDIPPPTPLRGTLLTLATCPWCLSFWIALLLVPIAFLAAGHPAYLAPALVLTASYITGWLTDQERD